MRGTRGGRGGGRAREAAAESVDHPRRGRARRQVQASSQSLPPRRAAALVAARFNVFGDAQQDSVGDPFRQRPRAGEHVPEFVADGPARCRPGADRLHRWCRVLGVHRSAHDSCSPFLAAAVRTRPPTGTWRRLIGSLGQRVATPTMRRQMPSPYPSGPEAAPPRDCPGDAVRRSGAYGVRRRVRLRAGHSA